MQPEYTSYPGSRAPRPSAAGNRGDWLYLAAVTLLGLIVRAYFLNQPMRFDESMTFLEFIAQPSRFFYYLGPNNQVLHTILVKYSTLIFGPHPAVIRLPAFLAGAAAIPLSYLLCRRLNPGRAGLLAPLGMAVFPYLVLFSTNARGYSLQVLLSIMLALVLKNSESGPRLASSIAISCVAALGLLALPSTLFIVAGLFTWHTLALLTRRVRIGSILSRFALPVTAGTLLLTLLLYLPVFVSTGGVLQVARNQFVTPQSWSEFARELPGHIRMTGTVFGRDLPLPVLCLGLALFAAGLAAAAARRNWSSLLLFPCLVFGSGLILTINHRIPWARTWIFFIPFFLAVADAGFSELLRLLSRRFVSILQAAMIILGAIYVSYLVTRNSIGQYPDTGFFPEAPSVVESLKPLLVDGDVVHVFDTDEYPLSFYLWYNGLPRALTNVAPDAREEYYVVHRRNYSLEDMDMNEESVVKVLSLGEARVFRRIKPDE